MPRPYQALTFVQDLKADNILVETTGVCKISDFGISKRTDDINMAGVHTSMQGTVFWMAPEVVNSKGKGYNSKIDIWSVGCVVFEMWTGQRPWLGREAMAVLLHVRPLPAYVFFDASADDVGYSCIIPSRRPRYPKASSFLRSRTTSGLSASRREYT